jgi:hypothetical protein
MSILNETRGAGIAITSVSVIFYKSVPMQRARTKSSLAKQCAVNGFSRPGVAGDTEGALWCGQ